MSSLFRFQEKGNLEVLLFTIQSRMRANNQRVYTPKEGVLVADINKVSGTRRTVVDQFLNFFGKVMLRWAVLSMTAFPLLRELHSTKNC